MTGESQFKQPSPTEKGRIRMFLALGFLFFFISGLVMTIAGAYEMSIYSSLSSLSEDDLREALGHDYISATEAEMQLVVNTHLITASIELVFGILGFVMGMAIRSKCIAPLERGEYEESGRFMNIFMIMGFIFGLVIGGIFIFKAKDLLKRTAVMVSPQSKAYDQSMYSSGSASEQVKRCTICNSMLIFNEQTKLWFCQQCNRYQM
jgi:hypothetical protein